MNLKAKQNKYAGEFINHSTFGDVGLKVAHEGGEVEEGCTNEEVKVVGHDHVAVDEHLVPFVDALEGVEDERVEVAFEVGYEEELLLKAAVGDEVIVLFALNSALSSHGNTC